MDDIQLRPLELKKRGQFFRSTAARQQNDVANDRWSTLPGWAAPLSSMLAQVGQFWLFFCTGRRLDLPRSSQCRIPTPWGATAASVRPRRQGDRLFAAVHQSRLAHDCVRGTAPFRTRLDNNGQRSILAGDGYDVNDPERTFSLAKCNAAASAALVRRNIDLPQSPPWPG
jgi:hypothetical protein